MINLIEFLFIQIVEELLRIKEKKVIPRVVEQLATISLIICVESDFNIKEETNFQTKNEKKTSLIIVQSNIEVIIDRYFKLISVFSQEHLKLVGNKLFGLLNKTQSRRIQYLKAFEYIYLDISTNLGLRTSANFLNVIENFFIKLKSNKKERSVFALSVSKVFQKVVCSQKFENLDYTLWYQNIKPLENIAHELLKSRKEIESGLHLYTAVLSVSNPNELINNFENFLKLIQKFLKDKGKKHITAIECFTNFFGIYLNLKKNDTNEDENESKGKNKNTNKKKKKKKKKNKSKNEKIITLINPILGKIFPIKKKSNYLGDNVSLNYLEKLIKILSDWDLHFVMESIIFKILPPDRNNLQPERLLLGLKLLVSILIENNSQTVTPTAETTTIIQTTTNQTTAKTTVTMKRKIINEKYSSQLIKIIEQNFLQINKCLGNYYIFAKSTSKLKSINENEQKKENYTNLILQTLLKLIPMVYPQPNEICEILSKYILHFDKEISNLSKLILVQIMKNISNLRIQLLNELTNILLLIPIEHSNIMENTLKFITEICNIWYNALINQNEDGDDNDVLLKERLKIIKKIKLKEENQIEKSEIILIMLLGDINVNIRSEAFNCLKILYRLIKKMDLKNNSKNFMKLLLSIKNFTSNNNENSKKNGQGNDQIKRKYKMDQISESKLINFNIFDPLKFKWLNNDDYLENENDNKNKKKKKKRKKEEKHNGGGGEGVVGREEKEEGKEEGKEEDDDEENEEDEEEEIEKEEEEKFNKIKSLLNSKGEIKNNLWLRIYSAIIRIYTILDNNKCLFLYNLTTNKMKEFIIEIPKNYNQRELIKNYNNQIRRWKINNCIYVCCLQPIYLPDRTFIQKFEEMVNLLNEGNREQCKAIIFALSNINANCLEDLIPFFDSYLDKLFSKQDHDHYIYLPSFKTKISDLLKLCWSIISRVSKNTLIISDIIREFFLKLLEYIYKWFLELQEVQFNPETLSIRQNYFFIIKKLFNLHYQYSFQFDSKKAFDYFKLISIWTGIGQRSISGFEKEKKTALDLAKEKCSSSKDQNWWVQTFNLKINVLQINAIKAINALLLKIQIINLYDRKEKLVLHWLKELIYLQFSKPNNFKKLVKFSINNFILSCENNINLIISLCYSNNLLIDSEILYVVFKKILNGQLIIKDHLLIDLFLNALTIHKYSLVLKAMKTLIYKFPLLKNQINIDFINLSKNNSNKLHYFPKLLSKNFSNLSFVISFGLINQYWYLNNNDNNFNKNNNNKKLNFNEFISIEERKKTLLIFLNSFLKIFNNNLFKYNKSLIRAGSNTNSNNNTKKNTKNNSNNVNNKNNHKQDHGSFNTINFIKLIQELFLITMDRILIDSDILARIWGTFSQKIDNLIIILHFLIEISSQFPNKEIIYTSKIIIKYLIHKNENFGKILIAQLQLNQKNNNLFIPINSQFNYKDSFVDCWNKRNILINTSLINVDWFQICKKDKMLLKSQDLRNYANLSKKIIKKKNRRSKGMRKKSKTLKKLPNDFINMINEYQKNNKKMNNNQFENFNQNTLFINNKNNNINDKDDSMSSLTVNRHPSKNNSITTLFTKSNENDILNNNENNHNNNNNNNNNNKGNFKSKKLKNKKANNLIFDDLTNKNKLKSNKKNYIGAFHINLIFLSEIIHEIPKHTLINNLIYLLHSSFVSFDHPSPIVFYHSKLLIENLIINSINNLVANKDLDNNNDNCNENMGGNGSKNNENNSSDNETILIAKKLIKTLRDKNFNTTWINEHRKCNKKIKLKSENILKNLILQIIKTFSKISPQLKKNWSFYALQFAIGIPPDKNLPNNILNLSARSYQIFRILNYNFKSKLIQPIIDSLLYSLAKFLQSFKNINWVCFEIILSLKYLSKKINSLLEFPSLFWSLVSLLKIENQLFFKQILKILIICFNKDLKNPKFNSNRESNMNSNIDINNNSNPNPNSDSNTNELQSNQLSDLFNKSGTIELIESEKGNNNETKKSPKKGTINKSTDSKFLNEKKDSILSADLSFNKLTNSIPKNLENEINSLQNLIIKGITYKNCQREILIILSQLTFLNNPEIIEKDIEKFILTNLITLLPFFINQQNDNKQNNDEKKNMNGCDNFSNNKNSTSIKMIYKSINLIEVFQNIKDLTSKYEFKFISDLLEKYLKNGFESNEKFIEEIRKSIQRTFKFKYNAYIISFYFQMMNNFSDLFFNDLCVILNGFLKGTRLSNRLNSQINENLIDRLLFLSLHDKEKNPQIIPILKFALNGANFNSTKFEIKNEINQWDLILRKNEQRNLLANNANLNNKNQRGRRKGSDRNKEKEAGKEKENKAKKEMENGNDDKKNNENGNNNNNNKKDKKYKNKIIIQKASKSLIEISSKTIRKKNKLRLFNYILPIPSEDNPLSKLFTLRSLLISNEKLLIINNFQDLKKLQNNNFTQFLFNKNTNIKKKKNKTKRIKKNNYKSKSNKKELHQSFVHTKIKRKENFDDINNNDNKRGGIYNGANNIAKVQRDKIKNTKNIFNESNEHCNGTPLTLKEKIDFEKNKIKNQIKKFWFKKVIEKKKFKKEAEKLRIFNFGLKLFKILSSDFKFCLKISRTLIPYENESKNTNKSKSTNENVGCENILLHKPLNIDLYKHNIFKKAYINSKDPNFMKINKILTNLITDDNDKYLNFTKNMKENTSIIEKCRINYFEKQKDTFMKMISLSEFLLSNNNDNNNDDDDDDDDDDKRKIFEIQLCNCLNDQQTELLNFFIQFINLGKMITKITNVLSDKEKNIKNLLETIEEIKQSLKKLKENLMKREKELNI
ncbi:furry-related [Anaeramoeba flamelloides]|uniref:Furry-related n=1 Tax=Anaeramoeba flamelloides TaxID=1746091 RepID=A0AAV7Y8K5_9EUKA|nr:furry-related [Anaeramoeba flamelloides]